MLASTPSNNNKQSQSAEQDKSYYSPPPVVSLPKGGGAIQSIGEKFAANPVTGTASLNIPIATTPSRLDFYPKLALTYDSGSGNGTFGFGWSLSVSAVARKTDKGLPQYQDEDESDVFVLSEAEDLVPVVGENLSPKILGEQTYTIKRYRPRIEGLFARIEKWQNQADRTDVFWKSVSKDNVTSIYGKNLNSRIADPNDNSRIFKWLLCESYDDRGNRIVYEYKPENLENVERSLPQEKNRLALGCANRYLKTINYGNRTPGNDDWLFQVVFDYGEHHPVNPTPDEAGGSWLCRQDIFSSFRAAFEIRTYRLCQRVLMYHHFPEELGEQPYLVRSTDFIYEEGAIATYLLSVTHKGYVRDNQAENYRQKSLPSLEFEYTKPQINETVQFVDPVSLENLPYGLDGTRYQWVDLDSEGLSGILTEQATAWFYKRNLSNIQQSLPSDRTAPPEPATVTTAQFAPLELIATKPSIADLQSGQQQLMDIAGDGQTCLVQFTQFISGYQEHSPTGEWERFTPFVSNPNVDWNDPNLKFIDLDGDGRADILIAQDEVFTWYPSLAKEGFAALKQVRQPQDEAQGPRLIFADATQSIYLADMDGDGLTDIVRILNGSVCYWSNKGYGRFGAKVTMADAPWFDYPDQFNQRRIRLADIDGSGTADIIYLGRNKVSIWFNQSGNSWSEPGHLTNFPPVDDLSSVQVVDLLGNGTACLVWSSPLAKDAQQPMRYIDLMGGQKPHLLVAMRNNLGMEQRLEYAASTRFYLEDKLAGTPWITKLPFPVHVLTRVEVRDRVSQTKFVSLYRYHHGYYDRAEREFRGFGMVEQWDTEYFSRFAGAGLFTELPTVADEEFHQPPVYIKTWFHTGAYFEQAAISQQFASEYYQGDDQAILLPDTVLPTELTAQEEREAVRSLKGMVLRQEIYALDGSAQQPHPYSVTESNYEIRLVQSLGQQRHAIFFTFPRESISYAYERNPADPRITQQITLDVDDFGNVLKSVAIAYPRRTPDPTLPPQIQAIQAQTSITYTENQVANRPNGSPDNPDWYRLGVLIETRTYEITGLPAANFYELESLRTQLATAVEIPYEAFAASNALQKRLIERVRTLYRRNERANTTNPEPLPLGEIESLALPCESFKIAFTPGLLTQVYGEKLSPEELNNLLRDEGKYVEQDGVWWIPSGRQAFDPEQFYLAIAMQDPFGQTTFMTYEYALLVRETIDPIGNTITITNDYRVMQPRLIEDPNGNRSEVRFDALGMVVGTAVMGKASQNLGDSFEVFQPDLTADEIRAFFDATDPHSLALQHLGTATTRIIYDLDRIPSCAAAIARETHVSDLGGSEQTKVQLSFAYSDGMGREALKKVQAEPGIVKRYDTECNEIGEIDTTPNLRWIGTGKTIVDNKGNPIKQYEPYFSLTPAYETDERLVCSGVTPILRYDPLGRLIHTDFPDGTLSKVEFTPWQQRTFDQNDTVLESRWYRENQASSDRAKVRAARLAAVHAGTPAIAHLDTLGRPFLTIAHNRFERDGVLINEHYQTRVTQDIEGNSLYILDARNNAVMVYAIAQKDAANQLIKNAAGEPVIRGRAYDLLGHSLYSYSMDAGERWMLNNVAGKAIRGWDVNERITTEGEVVRENRQFQTVYDVLQRLLEQRLQINGSHEQVIERFIYGEGHLEDRTRNLRGQVYQHYDPSGLIANQRFDFKGNLLEVQRQLASVYNAPAIDWTDGSPTNGLSTEVFTQRTEYDALNRMTRQENWHRADRLDRPPAIYEPQYNQRRVLVSENLTVRRRATEAILNIEYNAKGQRTRIQYGNGTTTRYYYDSQTFRLVQLRTTRTSPGDRVFQDLHYTYDPVGNITEIRDDAQQTVYFDNTRVDPHCQYEYDSLYRLIRTEGREHAVQNNVQRDNTPFDAIAYIPFPNSPEALQRYTEEYVYDSVGNILSIAHSGGSVLRWKRCYQYAENSNRLLATGRPGDLSNPHDPCPQPYITEPTLSQRYDYDTHGNMLNLHRTPEQYRLRWDYRDMIHIVNLGGGGQAFYNYDAGKQRTRKRIEHNGSTVEERLYLGGMELYRRWLRNNLVEEIETHHLFADDQRVLIVEDVLSTDNPNLDAGTLYRYQYSNHLGSVSLEMTGDSSNPEIISYQEYHPYGTTAYQAINAAVRATAKRYRYTGMERDEETGLSYHTVRYYLPWLGRWLSADPMGITDGDNLYFYVNAKVLSSIDRSGSQTMPIPGINPWLHMERAFQLWRDTAVGIYHGVARTVSLRTIPAHPNPTAQYRLGEEGGASIVAILDPAERFASQETVTGYPADRRQAAVDFLIDVVPEAHSAIVAARAEARALRTVQRAERVAVRMERQAASMESRVARAVASDETTYGTLRSRHETGDVQIGPRRSASDLQTDIPQLTRSIENPLSIQAGGREIQISTTPGTQGIQVPGRISDADMGNLQRTFGVEFALVYRTGPGPYGRGGTYWLYSGHILEVDIPILPNIRLISHTHPRGGPVQPSIEDAQALRLLRQVGSPQRRSAVVQDMGNGVVRSEFGVNTPRRR